MNKPRCPKCGRANMMSFDKRSKEYKCGFCWKEPYYNNKYKGKSKLEAVALGLLNTGFKRS